MIMISGILAPPQSGTGYDYADPAAAVRELVELAKTEDDADITLNSPGGIVTQALLIKDTIERRFKSASIHIPGICASAATLIASATNARVSMSPSAIYMVHNPWTAATGTADDLHATADLLEKREQAMITIYARRTGLDHAQLRELMDAETWLTAQEALDLGFIDSIEGEGETTALIFDTTIFQTSPASGIYAMAGKPISVLTKEAPMPNAKSAPSPEPSSTTPIAEPQASADEVKAAYERGLAEGTARERARLQALDELSRPETAEAVAKAKYETFATAEQAAIEILKAQFAAPKAAPAPAPVSAAAALSRDAAVLAEVTTPQPEPESAEEAFTRQFIAGTITAMTKGA